MNDDYTPIAIGAIVIVLLAIIFGACSYAIAKRAECVSANAARSAGDVIAICGRP